MHIYICTFLHKLHIFLGFQPLSLQGAVLTDVSLKK